MGRLKTSAREKVLRAAYKLAVKEGLHKLTRDRVAKKAGVASGTVSYSSGSMRQLRAAVVQRAMDLTNVGAEVPRLPSGKENRFVTGGSGDGPWAPDVGAARVIAEAVLFGPMPVGLTPSRKRATLETILK